MQIFLRIQKIINLNSLIYIFKFLKVGGMMAKHRNRRNSMDSKNGDNNMNLSGLFTNMNLLENINLDAIKDTLNKIDINELSETLDKYNIFMSNTENVSGVNNKTEILIGLKSIINSDRSVLIETLVQLYFFCKFVKNKDT